MTEADGLKDAVYEILNEMPQIVGNGAAAMTELNEAIALLMVAVDKLKGSRVFALQELEQLIGVSAMTERLLQDSNSIDVMGASDQIRNAGQDLEDYSNRVGLTVNKLDQVLAVLKLNRRDQELNVSGARLQKAVEHLQLFRNYL